MKSDKKILNEIAMKLGKVYTAKDNPPFQVNEAPTFSLNPQPNFKDKLRTDLAQKYPDLYAVDDYLLPTDTGDVGKDFLNTMHNKRSEELAQKYPDMYKPLSIVQKGNKILGKDIDYTDTATNYAAKMRDKIANSNKEVPTDDNLWAGGKWWQGLSPGQKVLLGGGGIWAASKLWKYLKNRRQKKKDAKMAAAQENSINQYKPQLNEGPSYEYRKHTTKIAKTTKQNQLAVLDLYELLRKKGLDKEAAMLLDAYKKNLVTFKKTYDMIMRKLV